MIPDITSDGQICQDDCAFRGYSYSWCNAPESWGYCTPAAFLKFLSRLHSNSASNPSVPLPNITLANLDRDQLLVEDKDANIIDTPITTTTVATTTTTSTTLLLQDPEPVRIFDPNQFIEEYDQDDDGTSYTGGLNDEINAATDLNSELYPRYYKRAAGFTVFGESCYDACEIRDGYEYTWCHKFKESTKGTYEINKQGDQKWPF